MEANGTRADMSHEKFKVWPYGVIREYQGSSITWHDNSIMFFPKRYHWEQNEKPSQYPTACLLSLPLISNPQLWKSILPGHFQYEYTSLFFNPMLFFPVVISTVMFLSICSFFAILESLFSIFQNSWCCLQIWQLLPHDFILFVFLLFYNVSSTWPSRMISIVTNLSSIHTLSF